MLFADLCGWMSFVDAVEPEELMRVLREFHGTIGDLVKRFDATLALWRATASSSSSTTRSTSPTPRFGQYG